MSLKPAESSKPILSSGYELSLELINMVQDQPFLAMLARTPITTYVILRRPMHADTLKACPMKL
jgi:hypothetical protein